VNEEEQQVDEQQADALNRAGFEARIALFDTIRLRAEGATSAQLVNLAEAWAWLTSPAQPHGSSAAPKGAA
jgi:hypothetical protein